MPVLFIRIGNHVDQLLPSSSLPADTTLSLPTYSSMAHLHSTQTTTNSASSSQAPGNDKDIVKCTYLNEINKDELPKPNFVSSVKNLFERQISSSNSQNGNCGGTMAMPHSPLASLSPPHSFTTLNNPVHIQDSLIRTAPTHVSQHKQQQQQQNQQHQQKTESNVPGKISPEPCARRLGFRWFNL